MAQIALAAQAASSVATGLAGFGAARAERNMARTNAYIGETRAIQTAAQANENVAAELATMRTAFAGAGQAFGPQAMPFIRELSRVRGRDTRIAIANEKQGAADWRARGRSAMAQGRASLLGGLINAGPSLYDIYQLRQSR